MDRQQPAFNRCRCLRETDRQTDTTPALNRCKCKSRRADRQTPPPHSTDAGVKTDGRTTQRADMHYIYTLHIDYGPRPRERADTYITYALHIYIYIYIAASGPDSAQTNTLHTHYTYITASSPESA